VTPPQKYIIIIGLILAVFVFTQFQKSTTDLPNSVGDPLELIIVKNSNDFDSEFYKTLKNYLTIDIGPSPQNENLLSILQVEKEKFTSILKRHQNLLFVSKSDTFNIMVKKNLFAQNQAVILIECPSYELLTRKKPQIIALMDKIKEIEIKRLIKKFSSYLNKQIQTQIKKTHNISLSLPQDFFLAYSDSSVTWARRETPKASQGILIINVNNSSKEKPTPKSVVRYIDSVTKVHVGGPINISYMVSEKLAPIFLDTIRIKNYSALKIQSLWRMENDFMGGIYISYYFDSILNKNPLIIHTYLYAPDERKNISLLQLESIAHSIEKLK